MTRAKETVEVDLTEAEMVEFIRRHQGEMTNKEYAALLGISDQYLADIYKGRRSPGDKAIKHFGGSKIRETVVKYRITRAA